MSRHPLGELIEHIRESSGWTLEAVAARARDRGHKLSAQNISRLTTEPVLTLKVATVKALAAGLDVPPELVISAAVKSMGFTLQSERPRTEEAVARDPRFTARDRRVLRAVIDEMVEGCR